MQFSPRVNESCMGRVTNGAPSLRRDGKMVSSSYMGPGGSSRASNEPSRVEF